MADEKLNSASIAQMLRGVNGTLLALAKIFPTASPEELLAKAQEIEASPVACELLCMVLVLGKIRVG